MALPLSPFAAAAARSVAQSLSVDPDVLTVTRPPKPSLGDFAVGCFPVAKQLKKSPADLAKAACEGFHPSDHLESAIATGPFVNFSARRKTLFAELFESALAPSPKLVPTIGEGKVVCVDFSSPNISKHLAYHHIRSTVIGHSLTKLYRALGHRVVGINHLGDWGTTHGMLLAAADKWGEPSPLTIEGLNALYVRFREAMKTDESLDALAREWFVRLENGDASAKATWQKFRDVSWAEFAEIYQTLGIEFDEVRGESAYQEAIPGVLAMLKEKGLTEISDGALVVPQEGENTPPLLLRKKDGATLYGTRDLATAMYRHDTYGFTRNLYVVDRGQALHFSQVFSTLVKAGFAWAKDCVHVPFGLVRIGGKKTGTRSGNVVLLRDVLAEAQERCTERLRNAAASHEDGAKSESGATDEQIAAIAKQVGIGAVVFANLSSQRDKDVDFSWDDVLSWEGDAGPYAQYTAARCSSILRKAKSEGAEVSAAAPESLTHDLEWAVARHLADYADIVARAAYHNEPHHIARYVLDLSSVFSRWYTAGNQDRSLRVLSGDKATQGARLALVKTARVYMEHGLSLLGIDAPEKM